MEDLRYSTAFVQDKRRSKADGTYPVKLRLTYQREYRLYGTVYSMTEKEFEKVMGKKPRGDYGKIRDKLDALKPKVKKIINDLPVFSFDAFADKWYEKTTKDAGNLKDLFFAFDQYIKSLERENRIGNATAYSCALNSLKTYTGSDTLTFDKVTVKFLKEYEAYMIREGKTIKKKGKIIGTEGNSLTTVGIYLRCLRSIFNNAVSTAIVRPELYPFGSIKNKKYSIPAPQNNKRALSMDNIKKIFDYTPVYDAESMYRDLWIFSYLCNGANMKDICLLKYSDISTDTITFRRAKTVSTSRNTKPITATYTDHLRAIVDRWGNKPQEPKEFVFPFLNHSDDETRIKERVAEVVKQVNKYIKRIAAAQKIPGNVTTYTARHSFATTLRRAGVNVSFISESMGHSDIKTTESYLASIEDEQRKEIAGHLTNF